MLSLSDNYLRRVADNKGVPEMYIDDACQEARIALWLAPEAHEKTVAVRAIIDFVRVYGRHTKRGVRRETVSITDTHPAPDPYPAVNALIDFRAAWRRLRPSQRRVLAERAESDWHWRNTVASGGTHFTNGHQVRVARARRRLRDLLDHPSVPRCSSV